MYINLTKPSFIPLVHNNLNHTKHPKALDNSGFNLIASKMAKKVMVLSLVLILMTTFWAGVIAQSNCTTVLISLSPCLDYVSGNSTTPSPACCTQLANVVMSQPRCLCEILNDGGASLGLSINRTQALALPKACNVQTPPISECNATSPASSPSGAPQSPCTVPSSSGSASKTLPSTDGSSREGSYTRLPFLMLLFLLFVASYGS
ncbi:Bifunctional inhibitor/plant lipid transfer protein/seed storage helical domain, partial [Dillenia turbinata]